jgi:hypothetical protein
MFRKKHLLCDDNPDSAGGGGGENPIDNTAIESQEQSVKTPADDAKAIEKAAYERGLAAAKKDFEEKARKEKENAERQKKIEQGNIQALLDEQTTKNSSLEKEYNGLLIQNTLAKAAGQLSERHEDEILALWQAKATVEDGVVKIDGLSPDVYIADFLKKKPFYAKPKAQVGSGAPNSAETPVKNPFSKDAFNLTEQLTLLKNNPTLAAQLKAAAK